MQINPAWAIRRLAQALHVVRSTDGEPRHIYTDQDQGGWGHNWFFTHQGRDIALDRRNTICGHLPQLPRVGDEFRVRMRSGKLGKYLVRKVEYCLDPPDMFFADVEFTGYIVQ